MKAAPSVLQKTTGTGTGNLTLVAMDGYQTFADAFPSNAVGEPFWYHIRDLTTGECESGEGYINAGALVRAVVIDSTNAGAHVDFAAGTKHIACDTPASLQEQLDTLSDDLDNKADASTTTAALATKANTSDVNAALALKANAADVPTDGEIETLADGRITAQKGQANGLAPLGGDSKINVSYLPAAVLGAASYQGAWDATANSPALASGVGTKGYYYKVSVAGSTAIDGINEWKVGDWIIFNGATWDKIDNTDQVTSVNGQQGAVVIDKTAVGLGNVDNTSDANKPVSTAQAAAILAAAPAFDLRKADPVLIWDFDDSTTVTTASGGTVVASIAGKYGIGPTIAHASTRPAYQAPSSSQKGAAVFTGAERLTAAAAPIRSLGGKYEIIFVAELTAADEVCMLSETTSQSSPRHIRYIISGDQAFSEHQQCRYQDSVVGFLQCPDSAACILYNGVKKLYRRSVVDGVMFDFINGNMAFGAYTFDMSPVMVNQITLGGSDDGGTLTRGVIGKVYDVIVLPSDKYALEVEGVLAAKHGLQSALPSDHPYKSQVPNYDSRYYFQPKDKPVFSMAQIGDSLTGFATGNNSATQFWTQQGSAYWMIGMSGGLFTIAPGNSRGTAGEASVTMKGRVQSDFNARTFDFATVQGGINNLQNVSAESVQDDMMECAGYFAGYRGVPTILWSMTPSDGASDATEMKLRRANDCWAAQDGRFQGRLIYVDTWSSCTNYDGTWVSNASPDTLHPNNYGGYLWGKKTIDKLRTIFPFKIFDFAKRNILANGLMAGTAGTAGALATGTVADSYTVNGVNGAGGTITRTASKVGPKIQKLVFGATGGAANDTITISQAASQGVKYQIGETLYGVAEIEVIGTPVNIVGSRLSLALSGTGVQTFNLVEAYSNETSGYRIPDTYLPVGKHMIVTPDLPITAGTSMTATLTLSFRADSTGGAASLEVNVHGMGIYKR